jgi:CMP-N-acetylneuraminic acid synthetase
LNGAIFITTPERFIKTNYLFHKKTLPFIMPIERSIDIDNEIDLQIAEILLGSKK